MCANIGLALKFLNMQDAANALDYVAILLGGKPKAFGLMTYVKGSIEKHAIGSREVLAKILLGHIQTQLKFEPGHCKFLDEDAIKGFANQDFDGSTNA